MAESDIHESSETSPQKPPIKEETHEELSELASLRKKVEALERQINDYKLLVADYENARKRSQRDVEMIRKYASEGLARDLLTALDNLDRAMDAARAAGESGPLVSGVAATAAQFLDILRRYGVIKMDVAVGSPFDPNYHQAVQMVSSSDLPPGSIVQVLQSGFQFHDRVLRPASVIVATGEGA